MATTYVDGVLFVLVFVQNGGNVLPNFITSKRNFLPFRLFLSFVLFICHHFYITSFVSIRFRVRMFARVRRYSVIYYFVLL